jgi:iron complex outermembrane receptor protein
VFGQINWEFTDTLELQVGARQNSDNNYTATAVGVAVLAPPSPPAPPLAAILPCPSTIEAAIGIGATSGTYFCPVLPSATPAPINFEDETPTYKVGLNWTPNDDNFFYVFFARGFKSGGVDDSVRFEPELIDDFELGWKGQLADGAVSLELGGFWMDYTQMQQTTFVARVDPDGAGPLNGSTGPAIQNVGDSKIKGIEASVTAFVGGWGFNASLGYTDSEIGGARTLDVRQLPGATDLGFGMRVDQCAPGVPSDPSPLNPARCFDYAPLFVNVAGVQNVFSPELSYNISVDYRFDLGNGGTLQPRITFSHVDEQAGSLFQADSYFFMDERDLVNVSLTYAKDNWSLQSFVNNVTDEVYVSSIDAPWSVLYGDPRQFGVSLRMTF